MRTRLETLVHHHARMKWGPAILAGVIAGGIVWLLSHGTPWFTSGLISPTLMGRDLTPPGRAAPYRNAATILAHLGVSVGYGLVVALVTSRLRGILALVAGGLTGFLLYLGNYGVFHYLLDWSGSELPAVAAHLVFGAVAAGIYKGLASRTSMAPP